MKEHNNDTELQRLLREKLEEHTVSAPDFVWPAIEKELFPPAKKRRPLFWWFVLSGLLLGTLLLFFLFPSKGTGISSGMSTASIRKSFQSTAHTITTPEHQSPSTTDQSMLNENSSSGTTVSKSNEYTPLASVKNNDSFPGSNSSSKPSKTITSGKSSGKQPTNRPPAQKSPSNSDVTPVVSARARASWGMDLLIAKTTRYFATVTSIARNQQPDSTNAFAMRDLSPKTIAFEKDTVRSLQLFMPPSESFATYSFVTFYFGAGRNRRTYNGIVESNSNAFIIDRTLKLKNTNFGIDYNYQFLPFASARIGFNTGSNRYVTRLFPIRIANTNLNDELEISSPSGDLKSAPLELDDQASSISDTTTFLMRIVHRSRYFSVPLTIRFNTTNAKGPQLYGYTGFDFVFRGNDQNTLIVRKSQFQRSYSTSNPRGARGFYSGWHLGVGLASNASRRLQFFSEFNYSQVFGNYYNGKVISIKSATLQLNFGLRINLKP